MPSQYAVELETVEHIHPHTHTNTHIGYLRSEIINANRAAADREGIERQTQGQGLHKQAKPKEKIYREAVI